MATPYRIKRSAVPGKIPQVTDLQTGELALNTHDVELYTLRDRFAVTGIATEVVRVAAGVTVENVIYVTADGNDNNTGLKLGDAKRTIKAAVGIATAGNVIKVSAGTYLEDNPIALPSQISIVGDNLREVTVTPQNQGDLFHVSPGNYITELSFVGPANTGAIFAFDPNDIKYFAQSPYIQNCTNFIPRSIGLRVDGAHALGPLKSMVLDSYTQYNEAGIGASITNEGYAQLVSLFTICDETAVFTGSGGACDLTNSNSSFGNYGLVSDGVSPLKFSGTLTEEAPINASTFTVNVGVSTLQVTGADYDHITGVLTATTATAHGFNVGMGVTLTGVGFTCDYDGGVTPLYYPSGNNGYIFEVTSTPSTTTFSVNVGSISTIRQFFYSPGSVAVNVVRPFDGQVVYFDQLYNTVAKVVVSAGGTGYTSAPTVTIDDPSSDWGITATAVAEILDGTVSNVLLISSGRGYTSTPNVTFSSPDVGINTATGYVEIEPSYFAIESSTELTPSGICTITTNENIPFAVGVGTTVPFYKQSRLLASGHSFEYIGSGTTIATALPQNGGIVIQDNEVDMKNGGLVVYTSTDQAGNFRIGEGVVINQLTGTISGNFYSKSLFANVTPLILALGGGE